MFDLVEQDALNPAVDDTPLSLCVVETFSPHPRILYTGAKISLVAWIVSVVGMSIANTTHKSFWLAYLTHWVLVISTAYIILSVLSAVYLALHPPARSDNLDGVMGVLVKSTWALFAIAAPGQVMVTILYWTLEFDVDDEVTYVNVMTHGIVMLVIMFDGFILSRIPIRMKQFVLFESVAALYILWTIIHDYSGIGNPYADGETSTQNDDAIYESIAWKNNIDGAAIICVVALIVANPVIFMACRTLSRLLPRRLCA
ncbi:hypothetical protein ACHAXA_007677 [Cyclostephanos tholiformis]|uniref:Uncharacterized protein n=1 Tax=Cyclostephanos tholiformis TaxID=382380 RepID=A0ABD3SDT1_9STRA